jgi:hypothetical protein
MKAKLSPWIWALIIAIHWLPAQRLAAAVDVYGEASSTGPVITVKLYADITVTPLVSFGIRLYYDPMILTVGEAAKNTAVWYFSSGEKQVSYMDPDVSTPGEVLIIGGKMDGRDPLKGVEGKRVLLGVVAFNRLTRDTPQFGLMFGHPSPYANFASTTGRVLDTMKGEVVFRGVTPDPEDLDLDGLKDAWEIKYFSAIGQAYWNEDPDRDGYNNLTEQAMGTNPLIANTATFRVSISKQPDGVLIEWPSVLDRTYAIESCVDLPNFVPALTGLVATPPTNRYLYPLQAIRGSQFIRILQEPPPK